MADPGEKLTVEELVELQKLLLAIGDQLKAAGKDQAARWELVREVVRGACNAVLTLRHDLNDEKKDEGPPFLLSCILTIALTAVPVTAISAGFFEVLALSVQRRLVRASPIGALRSGATRLERAARAAPSMRLERAFLQQAKWQRRMADEQAEKIIRTEEMLAKFSKLYEPEVTNTLQDKVKDLMEWGTKPMYEQEQRAGDLQRGDPQRLGVGGLMLALGEEAIKHGRQKRAEDVPLVAVENNLLDWIAKWVQVEARAEEIFDKKKAALFDLATTTVKKNFREKIETYRDLLSQEERPKDRGEAKAKIEALYKQFVEESIEEGKLPKGLQRDDLWDVQRVIESLIWCATYDFSPKNVLVKTLISGPYGNYDTARYQLDPPPFPPSFWEKLTKRYIDPDTYLDPSQPPKTFKEVGFSQGQSPELRLAHYFSATLLEDLTTENNAAIRRLQAVK